MNTKPSSPDIAVRTIFACLLIATLGAGGCEYKPPSERGDDREKASEKESTEQTPSDQSADEAGSASSSKEPTGGSGELGPGTAQQRQLLTRAKSDFLQGRREAAEKHFETLTQTGEISGPKLSGYIALAQIYNESERSEKVVELYEGLDEKAKQIPEVQIVMARAFAEQGATKKAIETYQALLDNQPDYIFALVELAELQGKAGDEKRANKLYYKYEKRLYSMAEKLESDETPPAEKIHILDAFSMLSDDKAVESSVAALRDPDARVRRQAATVLEHMRAYEATEVLKKVSEKDPNRSVRLAAKSALEELDESAPEGAKPSDKTIGPEFVDDSSELPAGQKLEKAQEKAEQKPRPSEAEDGASDDAPPKAKADQESDP